MHRTTFAAMLLITTSAGAAAVDAIPWVDLERVPDPVRAELLRQRALACGPVGGAGLPLPQRVRLVFVSCVGGPYCAVDDRALGDHEGQLTCPPDPGPRRIATMHLVSAAPLPELVDFYRQTLGEDYVELAARDGTRVTFVEPASADAARPWSPKRLHLALSPTRGPFAGAGYPSQIRITLSVHPPDEPRPAVRCRRFGVLPDDGSVLRRLENRFCWY